MEASDIKKVKMVSGHKVNHPFSVGNVFFAIFTLVIAAFPLLILFLPLVTFTNTTDPTLNLTGIQLLNYFITQIPTFMGAPSTGELPPSVVYLQSFITDENVKGIMSYVLLGQTAIIWIFLLNSVFALILFIVNICKGYLRHPGLVKTIAVFNFIFSIFFSGSFLYYFVAYTINGIGDKIFVWYSMMALATSLILLIIISTIKSVCYNDCVYEKDLVYKEDDDAEVHVVTQSVPINIPVYEQGHVLPPDIKSIGGHAYKENQNLIYANIPDGISEIGPGAFANCLKLKVVSLPLSVKKIGYNCFFNCVSLERLNYAGTKKQWSEISRGSNWLAKAKTTEVICVDGAIVVNPYR